MSESQTFCSLLAKNADESMYATASIFDYLILVEYPFPFGKDAFLDSEIPLIVKNHIKKFAKKLGKSRILLIRKKVSSFPLHVFIVKNSTTKPCIRELKVKSYFDLLNFEIATFFQKASIIKKMIFLVCTNGKKDRCCAKFGYPIYEKFTHYENYYTWQCSHIGGDRFAANIIVLPFCAYYGFVEEDDILSIIQCSNRQELFLKKFRGRSCFGSHVQAADFFLRQKLKITKVYGLNLINENKNNNNDTSEVYFRSSFDQQIYRVIITKKKSSLSKISTCSADKPSTTFQFHLINIERNNV